MTFSWKIGDRTVTKKRGSILRPMNPVAGTSLASMRTQFDKMESRWLDTDLCESLKDVLTARVLKSGHGISNCIIFGSGSFCGDELHWVDRHESAYYQIAAFKTVVDMIQQIQGHRPPCYAQEPCYNDLDAEFLAGLSITKMDHPEGFGLLNRDSFTYSPAAEPEVELQILFYRPAVWLHRSLDHLSPEARLRDTEPTKDEHELNFQMAESFTRNRERVELPGLNLKNFPFHKSMIWWKGQSQLDTAP